MNRKHNAGFSLVEVLIAIAVLGIIMIPTSTALVTFHRLNARTEEMFHEQIAVSSEVEKLMAKGIAEPTDYTTPEVAVDITEEEEEPYYKVEVKSKIPDSVSVTTYIRKAPTEPTGEEEQP